MTQNQIHNAILFFAKNIYNKYHNNIFKQIKSKAGIIKSSLN